jgi:hypothetical protein
MPAKNVCDKPTQFDGVAHGRSISIDLDRPDGDKARSSLDFFNAD